MYTVNAYISYIYTAKTRLTASRLSWTRKTQPSNASLLRYPQRDRVMEGSGCGAGHVKFRLAS